MSWGGEWTISNNADYELALQFVDRDGAAWDFSDDTFRADLKASADDEEAVASLTTANGGVLSTDLENGVITLSIGTFSIDPGTYYFDLIRLTGDKRDPLLDGKVVVNTGITGE
jgi:hypothetical protein